MNSVIQVVLWWLVMQVLGWISLPIAMRLFRWLPDRGYTFAKSLGLLLSSYLLWVGASSGLLRNEIGGILFSILLVAGLSAWLYLKRPAGDPSLEAFLREKRRLIWTVECLFAAGFILGWCFVRSLI
jgi:uncharacterized membrane protein